MNIKILNKTNNEVVFVLEDVNYVIANTLRRLVNSEVCTLSIENVHINKNSSALYDEMLAHRLGLIPLKTDLKSYTQKDKCKCKEKGCVHCELKFSLKAKGPCTVYASDLKSMDPKIGPVHPNIPIVKLLKGHEIDLEATAILSSGKDHAKFSPGLVYYHSYPDIKIGKGKNYKKAAEVCPVNILEASDGGLKVKDKEKCILCKACENVSDAIKIESSKNKFIFNIESWGQIPIKEMLTRAVNVMDEKLSEFEKLIKQLK